MDGKTGRTRADVVDDVRGPRNVPLPDGKPALADEVKLTAELYFVRVA